MNNRKRSKTVTLWLSVLFLFICVAATTVAITGILGGFQPDDSGAISLIPDSKPQAEGYGIAGVRQQEAENCSYSAGTQTVKLTAVRTEPSDPTAAPSQNPGFEAEDGKNVWSTNTQVEIFRVSYENGEQTITVKSDGGDKVIAPGTGNSYTFKLKNTGNVALDYTVEIDAYFTPSGIEIPLIGRLNRYDGEWIVGSQEAYAAVSALDAAEDSATLGAGNYTYYTLDWVWPFENGNDEWDTLLGNMAEEQDICFTIVIKTTAMESADPDDDSGITPPKTGDNADLALWILLAVCSFMMMLFLLFHQDRENWRSNAEADEFGKA